MKTFITTILILAVIGFPMIGFILHRLIEGTTRGEDVAIVMTCILGVIACAALALIINRKNLDL